MAAVLFQLLSGIFFYIRKKKIITEFKQTDSAELRNISGEIVTENGFFRKKIRWCNFDIFLNENSVFLFPKDFYFIPGRFINLTFNSDKRNTKNPTGLRSFSINNNSIVLISYPNFLLNGKRTIYLKNLTAEQIKHFQEALKSRQPVILH